jgi:hypothetical protein
MTDAEAMFDLAMKSICRALGITPLAWATAYFAQFGMVVIDAELAEKIADISARIAEGDDVPLVEITDLEGAVHALPGWRESAARVLH